MFPPIRHRSCHWICPFHSIRWPLSGCSFDCPHIRTFCCEIRYEHNVCCDWYWASQEMVKEVSSPIQVYSQAKRWIEFEFFFFFFRSLCLFQMTFTALHLPPHYQPYRLKYSVNCWTAHRWQPTMVWFSGEWLLKSVLCIWYWIVWEYSPITRKCINWQAAPVCRR